MDSQLLFGDTSGFVIYSCRCWVDWSNTFKTI